MLRSTTQQPTSWSYLCATLSPFLTFFFFYRWASAFNSVGSRAVWVCNLFAYLESMICITSWNVAPTPR
ncbi:hypothetical protein QR685DRAFT_510079 [Neurospora intermedia]|uniref:Secreted protein n=1 Tax=Neurospora intermedia TaxID=5142 RepID=A0ABR3DPB9_NEUIN